MRHLSTCLWFLAACGRIGFDYHGDGGIAGDGGADAIKPPTGVWKRVSVGMTDVCAITNAGELWCWGRNIDGQTATGMSTRYEAPHTVGTDLDWAEVSASDTVSCAIKTTGSLWCWGYGGLGAIADPMLNSHRIPTQIGTDVDWAEVDVGPYHVCARKTDGTVACWGQNDERESSGSGVPVISAVTPVTGNYLGVATGDNDSCALATDHTIQCWGKDDYGELGVGSVGATLAAPLANVSGAVWASIGRGDDETCGIQLDGSLWCWGRGTDGSAGNGTSTQTPTPMRAGSDTDWATVAAGISHVCALKQDGSLWCWGTSDHGELGFVTPTNPNVPTAVDAKHYKQLAAGGYHTCVIDDADDLWCSGMNVWGEIMQPPSIQPTPRRADQRTDWAKLSGEDNNSCGITMAGELYCWGSNLYRQVGDNTTRDRQVPVQVAGSWQEVATSSVATVAIASDGRLWTWGYIPGGGTRPPTMLDAATTWTAISANDQGCGVRAGTAYCWGENDNGQLGTGDLTTYPTPTVAAAAGTSVATGQGFACVSSATTVSCFGRNTFGQIGTGGTGADVLTPTAVAGLPGGTVKKVTACDNVSCALHATGALYCWGLNSQGQLATGNLTNSPVPVPSATTRNWADVDGGDEHFCGVATDGTLWCWAHGDEGHLGNGAYPDYVTSPVQVGTDTNWTSPAVGNHWSCALKGDGTRWCWGDNSWGQLGDGRAWSDAFVKVGG